MENVLAFVLSLCAFLAMGVPTHAQQSTEGQVPTTSAVTGNPTAAIDPEKEGDIRKLLELTGAKATFNQTIATLTSLMQKSLLQANPDNPKIQAISNLIGQQLRSDIASQYDDLVNKLIPVYDKYYTKDDIEGIIQFYGTPLGQKLLKATPDVARESQTIGYQMGSKIGRDAVAKVLQQHPELQGMGARGAGAN